MKRKNAFLTFLTSLIPGVGQMYQGYMKRGLSMSIVLCISIAICTLFGTPILALPILVIIAYSFFDTYNIYNRKEDYLKEDEYLWNLENKNNILKFDLSKRHRIIGFILVFIGMYIIFTTLFRSLSNMFELDWLNTFVYLVERYLPMIVISAISISFGIKLLSKNKGE